MKALDWCSPQSQSSTSLLENEEKGNLVLGEKKLVVVDGLGFSMLLVQSRRRNEKSMMYRSTRTGVIMYIWVLFAYTIISLFIQRVNSTRQVAIQIDQPCKSCKKTVSISQTMMYRSTLMGVIMHMRSMGKANTDKAVIAEIFFF